METTVNSVENNFGNAKVVLSYPREDLGFAGQLFAALTAADFNPLMDQEEIHGRRSYEDLPRHLGTQGGQTRQLLFEKRSEEQHLGFHRVFQREFGKALPVDL